MSKAAYTGQDTGGWGWRRAITTGVCMLMAAAGAAQPVVSKVEPPNWWGGMRMDTVRLLMYGRELDGIRVVSRSASVKVLRVLPAASAAHAFVDIHVLPRAAGSSHTLVVMRGRDSTVVRYPVLRRQSGAGRHQGFSPADVIYLITPDRFADGDPSNDTVAGMPDKVQRGLPTGRHGGDIQGIIDHLDYLAELGVTALWINPLVENNMPAVSYHGYSATDLYRIDPRFGTNELYGRLVREAHARGLKIILDHVSNHIGVAHPWMEDLPTATWINGSVASHRLTKHYKMSLVDPHADSATQETQVRGWFVDFMPDLNQQDPSLAKYIIENTIWWVESTGLDGIREDTYPYADQPFMQRWCNALLHEYPRLSIVGEVWTGEPPFIAPFQRGSRLAPTLQGALPSVTDFALFDAMMPAFGGKGSMMRVYECLAKDALYPDPGSLLIFLDNHDVKRILEVTGGDTARTKLALTLLLTMRGIPQLFYGDELAMRGGTEDGTIRADVPGGFPGDQRNAFTSAGRTPGEEEMYEYVRSLLKMRKAHPALQGGSLVHYPPTEEVYIYFRKAPGDTVMVIVNNGAKERQVDLRAYLEHLHSLGPMDDLRTGSAVSLQDGRMVTIPGKSGLVLGKEGGRAGR